MTDSYLKPMKRHDTGEPIRVQITSQANGEPVDLTGVSGSFHMYQVNDDGSMTELVNAPASVESPTTEGIVRYDWQVGDTTVVGLHLAEFELIFQGSRKESYPREGYIDVSIEPDLDDN